MSMKVIPPLALTSAMVTTSVPEVAPAVYASGTTYASGVRVSIAGVAGLMTVYQSLQAGNLGHAPASSPTWWQNVGDTYQSYSAGATYALGDNVIDPTAHKVYRSVIASNTGGALSDPLKWFFVGPTNAWAMFDILRSSATTSPVPITVTVAPGVRFDSLAFVGMGATDASVTLNLGGTPVYTASENLNLRSVANWYDYFFAPFNTQKSFIRFDVPPYSTGVLSAVFSNSGGAVSVGSLVIGMAVTLGIVQRGAESDVLNFSDVTRNSDGTALLTPERNVPKTISSVIFDKKYTDQIRAVRDQLNGAVAVWAGIDDANEEYFEALLILGFYRRFTINLKDAQEPIISLELEEV